MQLLGSLALSAALNRFKTYSSDVGFSTSFNRIGLFLTIRKMVEVPDIESFNKLVARVDFIQAENEFLKSLLLGERWLSRAQAMTALDCKTDKLRQLHVNGVLAYKYEGDRPYYDAFSIRTYLTVQKIDSNEADKRIIAARLTK